MKVIDYINDINSNLFSGCYKCDDCTEWEIALCYLPEGVTKILVTVTYNFYKTRNRKDAVICLKEAIKKYPRSRLLYDALTCYENENYSTEKEMDEHQKMVFDLFDEPFIPEIHNLKTILDLVGDEYKEGCKFYDELSSLKSEIEKEKLKHYESFEKIFNCRNSEDFKEKFEKYLNLIALTDDEEILQKKNDELDKIFDFFSKNPNLYYEGFLKSFLFHRDYEQLKKWFDFCNKNIKLPSIEPIEYLVYERQITNEEILNFLRVFFLSNNLEDLDKRVLLLYSEIFKKQGYPKASKRYLEIAQKKKC